MKGFIELRNLAYKDNNLHIFPLLFLENYIGEREEKSTKDEFLIKAIETIKNMDFKNKLLEEDIKELYMLLGENQYLDKIIVDIILKHFNGFTNKTFQKPIVELISQDKYNRKKLYYILDIWIELEMDILEDRDIILNFNRYKMDLDIVSILLEYIDKFNKNLSKEFFYEILNYDYPENIKMQIINTIENLYGRETIEEYLKETKTIPDRIKDFYYNYSEFIRAEFTLKKEKLLILQSMFYGDFENTGKGNNGGLAILLKNLGDEISKDDRVSYVITITITQSLDKPFINYYRDKHIYIRLPIYLDENTKDPFLKRELFIKRYIKNFLKKADIYPDVFHIRYLDNASKAIAKLCRELDKKLVFTLTPDPHRSMVMEDEFIKHLNLKEVFEKLNKIGIGDRLIDESDAILGIGNKTMKKELEVYFPQIKEEMVKEKIKMIGEGIQTDTLYHEDKYENSKDCLGLNGISLDFFERPIVLNVGRLSIQKGQIELLKAWSNSKLFKTHNLLIIGGDIEKPNKEEKAVIDFFKDYLKSNPQIKEKFFHHGAMDNEKIRCLEGSITKRSFDYPHIYLCSSKKEEFGIAILEAMTQGFLILGPKRGGVKSYIENEVNGFLIDTKNAKTIALDAEKYIYNSKISRDAFNKMQNAGRNTVKEFFSIQNIGQEFLEFYLSLKGVEKNDV